MQDEFDMRTIRIIRWRHNYSMLTCMEGICEGRQTETRVLVLTIFSYHQSQTKDSYNSHKRNYNYVNRTWKTKCILRHIPNKRRPNLELLGGGKSNGRPFTS